MARPNRLAAETSPYLLQHARNPVDWYPWGPEALGRAQGEDKPILLSIGYAACHWCHVMERESFEDERIAALMNEHFVCVKVDREERPDLDEIYMSATVALTGSGGWPMTVFLLPSGEPFFAGTYFPPEDRGGRPGFPTLLSRVAELWKQGRSELLDQARELTIEVRRRAELAAPSGISADAIRLAARQLGREYDASFGGFGSAPKFPPSAALSLLLRHHRRSAAPEALEMVERTLDAMASGGIYDQLGGGFCRYSTDERWLVPHFEKMLYDNAQLATVYLEAYQATGRANYRRVARETLDYLLREMQAPSGGFFSSSDADSEGEEGKFFVFTRAQVKKALGEPDATRFSAFYGVSEEGNFEGKNVLTTWRSLDTVSRELGVSPLELTESLERGKEALFELRSTRVPPAVDDKVLVSWNGLTVSALARGARTLSDPRYLEAARRAAEFVLSEMRRPDGGLYRTARAGRAHLNAYLEDYAFFAEGLLELYEAGGGDRYLQVSRELTARMLQDFGDEARGALFHTARDHEELYARPREGHDGALPSPNAVAARLLARLAAHTGDEALRASALEIARAFGAQLKNAPRAFATLLTAVDLLLEPPLEIVIVGDEHDEERAELVRAASAHFLPNAVLALVPAEGSSLTPLTEGKGLVDGAPAAYVCEGFACQKPLADPDELSALLLSFEAKNKSKAAFELGRGRLAGRATPEGTSRRAARSGLPDLAFTTYRGLRLSRISFGTYRSGLDHPEHRRTLTNGLERGINVIDTSSSFVWGDSERLVGEVLGELIARGELARDELFIVTKCGLALRASAERLAERAKNEATRPRLTVPLRPDAPWEEGVFSLDPEFLKEQISASLQRLGLETVDTLLVQSPEHLLLAGASRDELREALLETFRLLEGEVSAGRIGSYGVLTNTAASGDESRVDLLELLDATRRELGPDAHFRVVEMPGNLVERAVFDQDADGSSLVSRLEAQGLFTIVCRPLSALSGGALFRLVDPARTKDGAQAKNLSTARYKVASLEAEFETTLAPALRLAGLLGPEALLPLSRGLGAALERSESLEQFTQAEATLVTPRLRAVLAELDRAHQGPGGERWQAFRKSYVSAVGAYLACLHESAADKNQARLEALDRDIAERFPWKELEGARRNWATRALDSVLGTPGVSTVALGIRSLSHLDPALDCLGRLRERGS